MSRLPTPGSDKGTWGDVLNDFLLQSHQADGTLKPSIITSTNFDSTTQTLLSDIPGKYVKPVNGIPRTDFDAAAQASLAHADSSVLTVNGKTPVSGAVTLAAADVGAPTTLAGDSDVSIGTPGDGHLLTYDGSSGKWKNKAQTVVINSVSGLAADGVTDDSNTIQGILDALGTSSHSNEVVIDGGSTGSIYINGTVEILSSNTTLRFNSPVIMGPNASLRIWGELNENPSAGSNRPHLTSNAASGATTISVNNVSYFSVGSYIVIRGLKDANGNPIQRMNNTVTGITGNILTLGTALDSAYPILFTGSAYANNYTEVTAVIGSAITSAANRGDRTVTVSDSSQFTVGGIVQILDDDLNTGSDGTAQSQNYLHREMAEVKQVVDSTHIRLSHALHHTYDLSGHARIVTVLPVVNSHILNASVTFSAMNTINAAFWVQYGYGSSIENCSVVGNTTLGYSWANQAFRMSDSYHCLVDNCTARDPVNTSAGNGYGTTLYGTTYCVVRNCHMTSCRHSYLFYNGAAGNTVTGCFSEDACTSDYDLHGANCVDNLITGSIAVGGDSIPTDGAANKSACKAGNPNHLAGDQYNTFSNMLIVNYQGAAMEVVPGCVEISLRDSRVTTALVGLRLAINTGQTALQTTRTVWENVHVADVAQLTAIDGGTNSIVNGVTFDRVTWLRPTTGLTINNATAATVRRNVFVDSAIGTQTYAINGSGITKFIVKDNELSGTVRGIILANCPNARVTRNILHDLTDTTVYEDAGGNTSLLFTDNEIYGYTPIIRTSGTGPSIGGVINLNLPYFADTPYLHSFQEWNYDPIATNSSSTVPTAGTIYLMKLVAQTGGAMSNVVLYQGSNGASITTGLVALYSSSGTRLAVSADQSSTWNTGAPALRTIALTGGSTLVAGQVYYIALLSAGGTTQPGFARANTTTGPLTANQSNALQRFATNLTSQTSLPTNLTLSNNSGAAPIAYWVSLS
jgi:hypothetical protein